MTHPRQQIRDAAQAALAGVDPDFATSADDRVYKTRRTPWEAVELPAIAVYTQDETVDAGSRNSSPRELKRTVQLVIEAVVRLTPTLNLEDALDDFAVEIERAIDADETLGLTDVDAILSGTETGTINAGDRPVGMVQLVYAVNYYSGAPRAEDVALEDDFDEAEIRLTSVDGETTIHADNQAHDIVEDINQE